MSDDAVIVLAQLPETTGAVFLFSSAQAGLGSLYLNKNGTLYSDVFAANMDTGSYLQQTNTAKANEVPVF